MANVTHIQAFRAQPAFALEAKINVIGTNIWREGTPGARFFAEVLAQGPATVGEAIEKAAALTEPFTDKAVQGHLRWLYTSAGGLLEVDGVRNEVAPAPVKQKQEAPAKPVKIKKAKKAEAKAEAKAA